MYRPYTLFGIQIDQYALRMPVYIEVHTAAVELYFDLFLDKSKYFTLGKCRKKWSQIIDFEQLF